MCATKRDTRNGRHIIHNNRESGVCAVHVLEGERSACMRSASTYTEFSFTRAECTRHVKTAILILFIKRPHSGLSGVGGGPVFKCVQGGYVMALERISPLSFKILCMLQQMFHTRHKKCIQKWLMNKSNKIKKLTTKFQIIIHILVLAVPGQ